MKSGDLLATPTQHWKDVIGKTDQFASYIKDFQICVSGNRFAMNDCPYPISAGIYVGLRWTNAADVRDWSLDSLNALYRAFFWRNALRSRYDQGFLTKMSTDMKLLASLLDKQASYPTYGAWAAHSATALDEEVGIAPSEDEIYQRVIDTRPAGALGKALMLPLLTQTENDILDPSKSISFGKSPERVDLHHLFPTAWLKDNISSAILEEWYSNSSGSVDCVANLTPMIQSSNIKWRAKVPGKALADADVTPNHHGKTLRAHFISSEVYDNLISPHSALPVFWQSRARLIATELRSRMELQG